MDFDVFKRAVDSLLEFPEKIKDCVFAMLGEPTLNPKLPEMVKYIKKLNVSKDITVFTNAVKLTPEFSKRLVDAGLTRLRVSIEGVSDECYLELCGAEVSYQKIIENVEAFYKYKESVHSDCTVFVKTFDQSLRCEEEQEKFMRDFGNICDQIAIETIVPLWEDSNYSDKDTTKDRNMFKEPTYRVDVCPQPFYGMYVRSTGKVSPCCIDINHLEIGDVMDEGLYDIWNGSRLKAHQKQLLARKRWNHAICGTCTYPISASQKKDRIDHVADELYEKMFPEDKQ